MGYGNNEHRILEDALQAFRATTGLEADVTTQQANTPRNWGIDAEITIDANGQRFPLLVEIKERIDRAAGLAVAHTQIAKRLGKQGVLVTTYLPLALADHCRRLKLQFIDTAGNAYLNQPGLHVIVAGQRRPTVPADFNMNQGAGTVTALRIIFLILCRPELLNAPYREIAKAAGVALGAVGPTLQNLTARQYLIGGQGRRHLVEPIKLLDEWVTNYPIRLRPKLNARRFTAIDPRWWHDADLKDTGAYWGAEIAAAKLTGYLRPATCTIYVRPTAARQFIADIAARHKLRADLKGNIEILETFWQLPTDDMTPDVAPAPLVYADLMATLDPRNLEVAELIRTRYLEEAKRQP